MLLAAGVRQVAQLRQQQRILEDALDRFDQIRFERAAVLLLRIARAEELLQLLIALVYGVSFRAARTKDVWMDGGWIGTQGRKTH